PLDAGRRTSHGVDVADGKGAVTDAVNGLMGAMPAARFRFIREQADFAKVLDISRQRPRPPPPPPGAALPSVPQQSPLGRAASSAEARLGTAHLGASRRPP